MTIIASQTAQESFWQAFYQGFMEAAGQWMGDFIGTMTGALFAVLLYLLAVYLVWGFAWDRIITKAGFEGKTFWKLFALVVAPILLLPLSEGIPVDYLDTFYGLLTFSVWSGIMLVALLPWPTRKTTKNTSQKSTTSTAINRKQA